MLFAQDTLQRHTVATGFAGISTDAALPLSKAASMLSLGINLNFGAASGHVESLQKYKPL